MARTSYSMEPQIDVDDIDQTLREAEQSREEGKPLKIRMQPQLWIATPDRRPRAGYQGWRGVYWGVECETTQEVREVRDAIAACFKSIEAVGALRTSEILDALSSGSVESAPSGDHT